MNGDIDFQEVLKDVYGIDAAPVGEPLRIDMSAVQVYTRYPDQSTIEDYGKFEMQQFQAGPDEIYNLVKCDDDFSANENLFNAMQDEERRDVKDYELIAQKKARKEFFLYKLIPYMVQGKPTWY